MFYDNKTIKFKVVSNYTGLDFEKLFDVCVFDFYSLLRDAVIYNNSKTENGRDYLEQCWILEQTKPDRKKLRDKYGKGTN